MAAPLHDEPGLFFEMVAYRSEEDYARDQERVEHDVAMGATLAEWRSLMDGAVEVRRFRPTPL